MTLLIVWILLYLGKFSEGWYVFTFLVWLAHLYFGWRRRAL